MRLVDEHDAIVVPEDLGGARSALAVFTVALFALLCVGTLAVDVFWPAPAAKAIGGEAQREAELERKAKFSDGTLAALIDRKLRMTSRVRRVVGSPYALMLYEQFNYTHGDVSAGPDGWLFLEPRNFEHRTEAELRQHIDAYASMLAYLALRLEAIGSELVVMPVPRKEAICAEHLPAGIEARQWVEPYVIEQFRSRRVPCVDLAAAWAQAPSDEWLYYRAGSHWTPHAERLAAEEVARFIGARLEPEQRRTRIQDASWVMHDIDLLVMAGVDHEAARKTAEADEVAGYNVVQEKNDAQAFTANEWEQARIAVVGTSFTNGRIFRRLLAHAVGEPVSQLSELGGGPAGSFLRLLEKRAFEPPAYVVYELPIHLAPLSVGTGFEALMLRLPSPEHVEVLAFPERTPAVTNTDLALGAAPKNVGALPRLQLFQDGSGWTYVRLRGAPSQGAVRVQVRATDGPRHYLWPANERELLLPLPTGTASAKDVSVFLSAPPGESAKVRLESIHVVVIGDVVLHRFEATRPSKEATLGAVSAKLDAERMALMLKVMQPAAGVGSTSAVVSAHTNGKAVWSREVALRDGITAVVLDASELSGLENLEFRLECEARPIALREGALLTMRSR